MPRAGSRGLSCRGGFASLLATAVPSCAPEPEVLPLPEPTWFGNHVEIGASVDLEETCAGTLRYVDRYVGELHSVFGVPPEEPIEVYWLPDGVEAYEGCGPTERRLRGCSVGRQAMSERFPVEHELVHAVWDGVGGGSHAAFEEGLATYYGDDFLLDWGDQLPIRDAFAAADEEHGVLPSTYYATVANFVSFIASEFGRESMLELVASTEYGSSVEAVDDRMRSILGVGFDEVVDAYEEMGYWCLPYFARDPAVSCALAQPAACQRVESPSSPTPDISVVIRATLSCGEPGVIGPKHDELWSGHSFEVVTEGVYRADAGLLLAPGAEPTELPTDFRELGTIAIESCSAGCLRGATTVPMQTEEHVLLNLEPGVYRARISRTLEIPEAIGGFALTIRPQDPEAAESLCEANSE